jgi:hypothetical protein
MTVSGMWGYFVQKCGFGGILMAGAGYTPFTLRCKEMQANTDEQKGLDLPMIHSFLRCSREYHRKLKWCGRRDLNPHSLSAEGF